MAKIVTVGYGVKDPKIGNTTDGYSYVVNDNIRTGQVIQVISTNWRNGKKFATSATTQHAYRENSVLGQDARAEAGGELTEAFTGKELGATGSKQKPAVSDIKGQKPQSDYTLSARAGAIKKYSEQHIGADFSKNAQQTFDEYSKKFMGGQE